MQRCSGERGEGGVALRSGRQAQAVICSQVSFISLNSTKKGKFLLDKWLFKKFLLNNLLTKS